MRPLHARRRGLRPATTLIVGAAVAATALVWHASSAAFTASGTNGTGSWTTGTVVLADDDGGSALFVLPNLVPGSTGQQCIQVQYNGTVPVAVKLYASSVTGGFAPYVTMAIDEGSGGSFGDCSAFVLMASDYTGTLAGFGSARTGFSSGVSAWAPSAAGSRVFRFSYTVQFTTPDSAAGTSAAATFVWEAQST